MYSTPIGRPIKIYCFKIWNTFSGSYPSRLSSAGISQFSQKMTDPEEIIAEIHNGVEDPVLTGRHVSSSPCSRPNVISSGLYSLLHFPAQYSTVRGRDYGRGQIPGDPRSRWETAYLCVVRERFGGSSRRASPGWAAMYFLQHQGLIIKNPSPGTQMQWRRKKGNCSFLAQAWAEWTFHSWEEKVDNESGQCDFPWDLEIGVPDQSGELVSSEPAHGWLGKI